VSALLLYHARVQMSRLFFKKIHAVSVQETA